MRVEPEILPPAPCPAVGGTGDIICVLVVRSGGAGGEAAWGGVRTRDVVFMPPSGVGEGVVGVVYELEFAGAGGAFGGVGGDAVGVRFEGGAFVGVADLLLGCGGGDVEDGVCEC